MTPLNALTDLVATVAPLSVSAYDCNCPYCSENSGAACDSTVKPAPVSLEVAVPLVPNGEGTSMRGWSGSKRGETEHSWGVSKGSGRGGGLVGGGSSGGGTGNDGA